MWARQEDWSTAETPQCWTRRQWSKVATQRLISPLDNGAASMYNWELAGVCGLIGSRDATLLLLAGWWFSYWGATANQRAQADWSTETKRCFFLEWSMEVTWRYFYRVWVDWSTAESRRFFSWLINGLASYVRRRVGVQGRTDPRRQNNFFS